MQGTIKPSVCKDAFNSASLLIKFTKPHKPLLYSAIASGTMATVCLCVMWFSFARLVEIVLVDQAPLHTQLSLLIILLISAFCKVGFARAQSYFSDLASSRVRDAIRNKILHLWATESPLVHQQRSPASSASQWIEDVEAMDSYFARYLPQQALAVISPLIILLFVASLNWLCALLLLISAPLIPLFMVLVGMGAASLNEKYALTRQRLAGHFLDRVANLPTIRLFGGTEQAFQEIEYRSVHYRKVIMKTLRVAFLSSTVLEFFTSVAIASLAIYIGFSLYGAITWGPASTISLYSGLLILILAPEFFQPLRNLSAYYHDRASAMGAASNMLDLFNERPMKEDALKQPHVKESSTKSCQNASALHETLPIIRVDDLWVGFDPSRTLAKNISFSLRGNQMLAVTGASGLGKSALLNTLAGYLAPLHGHICTYPIEYSQLPMAYLPQKPWFKNKSIIENIQAFAPDANPEDINKAFEKLGLSDELYTRVKGLSTLLGEHQQGFSGGQLQRIALSRILLNPTPIILLDEPTAKLDKQSRDLILQCLVELKSERILVVASHDPALIKLADYKLSLDSSVGGADARMV